MESIKQEKEQESRGAIQLRLRPGVKRERRLPLQPFKGLGDDDDDDGGSGSDYGGDGDGGVRGQGKGKRRKLGAGKDGRGGKALVIPLPSNASTSLLSARRGISDGLGVKEGKNGSNVDEMLEEAAKYEHSLPSYLRSAEDISMEKQGLSSVEEEERAVFQSDVEKCAQHTGYDRVPVEEFGLAMLRGMLGADWDPKSGMVGDRPDVPVVEFSTTQHFGAAPGAKKKSHRSEGSVKPLKPSKQEETPLLTPTMKVRIRGGASDGQYALIVGEMNGEEKIEIEMIPSGKRRRMRVDRLEKVVNIEKQRQEGTDGEVGKEGKEGKYWLYPGILVRVASHRVGGEDLIGVKLLVDSVASNGTAVLRSSKGKEFIGVKPRHVQTVIPKSAGAKVCVVRGKLKGQMGSLVSRDRKSQRCQVNLDGESNPIVELHYDDVSQWGF
eukprot:TRINITY_DN46066_c0_g1_i1.p2 TRINITY_DN46066_c0_g1~~TRINITY_DN46066_c0_g1_i1.p2  ORF type:complete len:457 (+),score=156.81 TRINITY_DN46066_c0_g1_i1:60-1373(+)